MTTPCRLLELLEAERRRAAEATQRGKLSATKEVIEAWRATRQYMDLCNAEVRVTLDMANYWRKRAEAAERREQERIINQ